MPITPAAKKDLRQARVRALRNKKVKQAVKDLIKKTQKLIEAKDQDKALTQIKSAIKAIDQAVQKKVLKKNNGARKKSRLMAKLNKIGK